MPYSNQYWQRRLGGTSDPYLVPASGQILTDAFGWLGTSADEILRTFYWPTLTVNVNPTGGPTELWWPQVDVVATAWWTDITDSTFYGPDSDYDGLLLVGSLYPTMQPMVSLPTHYTVTWTPPKEGFSSKGRRKPQGGVTSPVVNAGLTVVDPLLGIQGHLHAGTSVFAHTLFETLWGTPF